MNNSLGCCLFCVGAGFVAGAMLCANNNKTRKLFQSSSEKLTEMYDDVMQKLNEKMDNCNCSCGSQENDTTKAESGSHQGKIK